MACDHTSKQEVPGSIPPVDRDQGSGRKTAKRGGKLAEDWWKWSKKARWAWKLGLSKPPFGVWPLGLDTDIYH